LTTAILKRFNSNYNNNNSNEEESYNQEDDCNGNFDEDDDDSDFVELTTTGNNNAKAITKKHTTKKVPSYAGKRKRNSTMDQSTSELRSENKKLKLKNALLEKQLEKYQIRIIELEAAQAGAASTEEHGVDNTTDGPNDDISKHHQLLE